MLLIREKIDFQKILKNGGEYIASFLFMQDNRNIRVLNDEKN
jgi:hypothetical protein